MTRRLSSADLEASPYNDLQHYNRDEDLAEPLPAVQSPRTAIADVEGLIIVKPDFNHGIPGGLKDALGSASRPGSAALTDKAALNITCSPAVTGGVRAHAQLHDALLSCGSRIVVRPQAVIGMGHPTLVDDELIDDASLALFDAPLADLIAMVAPQNEGPRA